MSLLGINLRHKDLNPVLFILSGLLRCFALIAPSFLKKIFWLNLGKKK